MGFLSKFKNIFSKKKISEKITQQNETNSFVKQEKFDKGLKHSSSSLNNTLNQIGSKYRTLNQELIDAIEEALISYDIGYSSTKKILNSIVEEIKLQNVTSPELIKEIIVDKLFVYYIQNANTDNGLNIKDGELNVILVVGVNGVGKTTSIAKLTNFFVKQGKKVCLIAGDTFRAGAVEQLSIWAERLNVSIFKPKKEGQDPASVVFEGMQYAKENKCDIVLCDTSGRLQNKLNLMNELKKVGQIIQRFAPNQPAEVLLVLDATTGQNGIVQAKGFNDIVKLTGIVLTKMDGTSRGGIVLSIKDSFDIPVKFIGLGEKIDDLEPFDLENFIEGLTNEIKLK